MNALLEIVGICLSLHQHCTLTIISMAHYRPGRMDQVDYKHNCVALVDHNDPGNPVSYQNKAQDKLSTPEPVSKMLLPNLLSLVSSHTLCPNRLPLTWWISSSSNLQDVSKTNALMQSFTDVVHSTSGSSLILLPTLPLPIIPTAE